MENSKSDAKRKIHSTKGLYTEIREFSYQRLKSTLENYRIKRSRQTQNEQMQVVFKVRAEINKIETKGTIQNNQ